MGKIGKPIQRAALDTAMSQGQVVKVDFRDGSELAGLLADVSENTFRFRGGCDLSYDNLGSVSVVGKGKSIKEKAIIAAADDRQVVITTVAEGKYTGWITSTEDDSFAWEHPLGAKQHFQNIAVKDIRFVGEPETKEESEGDETGQWVSAAELMKHRHAKDENADLSEKLTVAGGEAQDMIRRLNKYKSLNADLTERLTVAEADQEIVMECQAAPESLLQKLEHATQHAYAVTVSGNKSSYTITGKILRIGLYEAHGSRICVNFLSGSCVYLDTIQHVEIAYAQSDSEPCEPEDITNSGDMLSTTQRLEHHLKHNHVVEIDYMCPDRHIQSSYTGTIGMAQHDMHFVDGKSIPVDSITGIRIVIDENSEPEDTHIAAGAIWDKLNAVMEAEIEVEVDFDTNYTKGTLTGKVKMLSFERATIGEVDIYFVDMIRIDGANIHHLGVQPESNPAKPEDIAKQRWMTYKGVCGVEIRQRCDGHEPTLALTRRGSLDEHIEFVATDAQIAIMTAAPELADRSRALLRGVAHSKRPGKSIYPDGYNDLFELLDKLSIKELQTPGTSR